RHALVTRIRESNLARQFDSLESRLPRVDERRKIIHDGGRDEVLEVHPEGAGFEIDAAVQRSHFNASFATLRRLRSEHVLILGQAEVEGGRLERIPVICEQSYV